MARQVQLRRGTTAQHAGFTGAVGEVTVDTDKNTLLVHDGSTVGGIELSKKAALDSHLADGTHEKVIATDTDNATSSTNAPMKSAGGLAVAKNMYVGGSSLFLGKFQIYQVDNILLPKSQNKTYNIEITTPGGSHRVVGSIYIGGNLYGTGYLSYQLSYFGNLHPSIGTQYTKVVEVEKYERDNVSFSYTQQTGKITISLTNNSSKDVELVLCSLGISSITSYYVE